MLERQFGTAKFPFTAQPWAAVRLPFVVKIDPAVFLPGLTICTVKIPRLTQFFRLLLRYLDHRVPAIADLGGGMFIAQNFSRLGKGRLFLIGSKKKEDKNTI